jgi:ABC-2 type transport system permease protein
MNRRVVTAIARKDMRAIMSDSRVWLGMLLLPVLFGVILPAVVMILARTVDISSPDITDLVNRLTQASSGGMAVRLDSLETVNAKLVYLFLNYLLAPVFLLIPVINAMMIATNSFVGEKERRTLETLLFAPVDIPSLFAGKVLASFIPSYAAALGGFVSCGILAHLIAAPLIGGWVFPSWNWIWLVFWLAPQITFTVILVSAFVSARVRTFQQAQSIAGMVVLPVILAAVGQAAGLVILSPAALGAGGTALLGLNVLLLFRFSKMNQRHRLFENQVH